MSGLCALIRTGEFFVSSEGRVGAIRSLGDLLVENLFVSLIVVGVEAIPKLSRRSFREVSGGKLFVDSDIS